MFLKILVMGFLSSSVICFAEIKIGVVDVQRAMLQTSDGQRAKKTLEAEFKGRQETLHKMETKMRKMSEEFERKAALLAQSAKERRQIEIQSEMRKFQAAIAENQSGMEKRQKELLDPIVRKLTTIVDALAKKESFTLIISRPDQLVLYAAKEIDLTERVIKEYEKS